MSVYCSNLKLQGALLKGVNPLPIFRDREHDKVAEHDGTLLPEELFKLGSETGFRVLPYKMQDRYDRERSEVELKTIVIENEYIRAVFLPEYGGRLYSLYDLKAEKELLFCNPVFQPANLAIRNAWFSGGIEWNISQIGHTFTTCEPMFFGVLKDDEDNEFIRMYEYERTKKVFWQIDFHLPKKSKQLHAHVRIVNDNSYDVPMYWWTNIAARETKNARVFSNSKEVIYLHPWGESNTGTKKGFGHGEMPYLPPLLGKDASFSMNFNYSSEYFFQNSKEIESPFEAIAYEDGSVFYERSTQPLRTRKMFCWGNHKGGRHWVDFLSENDKGAYIEIQAGLCPTQLSGMDMKANSSIEFTQSFGGINMNTKDIIENEWDKGRDELNKEIDNLLSAKDIKKLDDKFKKLAIKPCKELIFKGSGWGALEEKRRKVTGDINIPEGFYFPEESLLEEQKLWLSLLDNKLIEEIDSKKMPISYMTDLNWVKLLEKQIEMNKESVTARLLLGILLYENGDYEQGKNLWLEALKYNEHPLLYRNLAYAKKDEGDNKASLSYMEKAFLLEQGKIDVSFTIEYLELLLKMGDYSKVWEIYNNLQNDDKNNERILIHVATAAIKLDEFEFLDNVFKKNFSVVREGETTLTDIWFEYHSKKLGIDVLEVKAKMTPPRNIDFRLS